MLDCIVSPQDLLCDEIFKDLNSGQKEAVLHRDGPMLVTAGPGSGKTHVITARLIYMLLFHHIPPEKILVITFTKEAAVSMKNRFDAAYQKIAAQLQLSTSEAPVSFGTFHSFYYRIIRSIPTYSKYRLIYEKEKKYILSFVTGEDAEDRIQENLTAISYYKNTNNIKTAAEMIGLEPTDFLKLIEKYDNEKNKRKVFDFDDMLYFCMKLLQNDNQLLNQWREKFVYYLVDEFQDCNPVQYHLLKLLASGNTKVNSSKSMSNVFVVGDDDQSIYGFRGADAMILQEFLKDYPSARNVTLGMNYRSSPEIVEASSKVISENKMRLEKKLTSVQAYAKKEKVSIVKWASRDDMNVHMRQYFKDMLEEEWSKHAVLFRTNQETQMFALNLMQDNISFLIKDKSVSIYDHFLVKDIMAFLKAANGNRERKIFLQILNKPRTHIGRECLETEIVDLERMKRFYMNPFMKNPAVVQDIERLESHFQRLSKMNLSLGVRYIRMAMNYESYLRKRADGNEPLLHSWQELLEWLQEDAEKYKSPDEWETYQKEYELKLQAGRAENDRIEKGVHLMTMHASKGLEFDHCHILNVNEGIIPKYQRGQKLTKAQLEEERRIFYVGMTRAKKTLELHYLTGTKERPKFPSRFIHRLEE